MNCTMPIFTLSCNGMNHVPDNGAEKLVTLKDDYPCMLATIISYQ